MGGVRSKKPRTRSSCVGVVERPEVGVLDVGAADRLVALRLLDQGGDELVVDPRTGEHPGGGRAVLAGVEVAGDGDPLGGRLDVGVVEDDDRCLSAELEVDPLDTGGRGAATSMPARTLPVTDTIAGVGCSTSSRPVSRSPQTTLSTPAGRCSAMISAISTVDAGVVSEGLSTMVLPAASAGAHFQTAIISG